MIFILSIGLSIFLSSYCGAYDQSTSQLVKDYFKWKNVGAVIIICCKQEDTFNLAKLLMGRGKGPRMVVANGANRLNDNVLSIKPATHYRLGAFVDLDCNDSKIILTKSSDLHLLHGGYTWLLWSNSYNKRTMILDTLDLGVDSDVTLAVPNVKLYDLYKIAPFWPLNSTEIGAWDSNSGLIVNSSQKRTNFHGVVFNATAVLFRFSENESDLPNKLVNSTLEPHMDSLTRLGYIMTMYLQDIYNFTINAGFSNNPGYKMDKGMHDGIIGQLEKKEIEFALVPFQITHERLDTIDYTAPIWIYRLCFIFRHPPTIGMYSVLVIPLSGMVWLCIGGVIVLTVLLHRVITQCRVTDVLHSEQTWSSAILLTVGSLTQQGLTLTSQRVSIRILCLFLLLLGIMVYAFYSASVVTALLSPPPKTIQTVQQLIQSRLEIGLEDNVYLRSYITTTNDTLSNKVYNRKISSEKRRSRLMPYEDGIKMLKDSEARFAFFAEDILLYRPIDQLLTGPEKCSLMEIELFAPYKLHVPIQKKSPLKESVTRALLSMREHGLLMRQNKIWRSRKPECMGKLVDSVTVGSMMTAYLILFIGVVLSLVMLAVEKIVHCRNGHIIIYSRYRVVNKAKLRSIVRLGKKQLV